MKARIVQDPRCAMLWRAAPSAVMEVTAKQHGCALRMVTDADLATAVGDLCAGKASPALPEGVTPPDDTPALIVSGLRHDNGELSQFLDAVKACGMQFPLRAMVTPTSKGWTLGALLEELHREHEAMGGRR